jgi:hypothetical protein
MDNSLKAKEYRSSAPATLSGPNPGDYPLGSLESRAAARATIASRDRSNAIPDNLTDEEFSAWIKRATFKELSAVLAPMIGKTIDEVRQMKSEDFSRLLARKRDMTES